MNQNTCYFIALLAKTDLLVFSTHLQKYDKEHKNLCVYPSYWTFNVFSGKTLRCVARTFEPNNTLSISVQCTRFVFLYIAIFCVFIFFSFFFVWFVFSSSMPFVLLVRFRIFLGSFVFYTMQHGPHAMCCRLNVLVCFVYSKSP